MFRFQAFGRLPAIGLLTLLCQCSGESRVPSPVASGGSPMSSGGSGAAGRNEFGGGGASAGSAAPQGGVGGAGGGATPRAGSGGSASAGGGQGGGASGGPAVIEPAFILGADISSIPEAMDDGASYVDTDGVTKSMLEILARHGFNYVRLRTFVDPYALYGYSNPTGDTQLRKAEAYTDKAHTVELASEVKRAGMGLLLDFHYSDNWADPGKQVIPEAWRDSTTIEELAAKLEVYTQDVVSTLVNAGARPDMVQIGNEITPGLLVHVPSDDPQPDEWGNVNKVTNAINGSSADWDSLATLLKAGVAAVKAVDPTIKIMLHVENTESFSGVLDWVQNAQSRGVELDVLGLSCYPAFQGEPEVWQDTFEQLAATLNDVSFVIAEYNPERTRANQIMHGLPDGRGRGTFLWEPTQSGSWGSALFTRSNNGAYTANSADFAEFDALKLELGL